MCSKSAPQYHALGQTEAQVVTVVRRLFGKTLRRPLGLCVSRLLVPLCLALF